MHRGVTIWLFLVLLLPAVPALADPCTRHKVVSVQFEGCDEGRCASQRIKKRLTSLTDLVGQRYTPILGSKSINRIKKVGYFREVTAECKTLTETTAAVIFKVVPNRYVRDIDIEGTKVVYKSDLEKRLFLRMGSVFNPGEKKSQERLQRQLSSLETFMRQQGFDSAKLKAETRLVEPDLVDIDIIVSEGAVSRIDRVQIRIAQPATVEGRPEYSCPKLIRREIRKVTEIQRGDLFTNSTSRKVRKRVRFYLQQYGFQSPRVKVEFEPESAKLTILVKVKVCFSISILERESEEPYGKGYERTKDPELYAALPFRESGVFDNREAQRGIEELLVYYRTRGYLFADVDLQFVDYRELVNGWQYPAMGGVVYRVTRGQPSEIREIQFTGNQQFNDDELMALLETRRYDFFDVGGFLQVEQLFGDLVMLEQFYVDHGYYNMAFPDAQNEDRLRVQLIRRKDRTIYRYLFKDKAFDVIKPNWENAIRIRIRIREGEGARIRSVRLEGITQFSPQEVASELELKPGGAFSASIVSGALRTLERKYIRSGFSPIISVRCSGEVPSVYEEECDYKKVQSRKVGLTFVVNEGAQKRMGEIFVVGNLKTRRSTIERDFPDEGELYDQDKVSEAVRRLRNLGVFSSVRMVTIGEDEQPPRERVAVVIQIEEDTTKFLELSGGFQTIARPDERINMHPLASDVLSNTIHYTGATLSGAATFQSINLPDVLLLGEFSYYDKNFLGYAKNILLPIRYGLSTTDPARYAAFTPTYFDRRFLTTDLTMRVTPLVMYDRALKLLDTFEYGGEIDFSYLLLEGIYMSLLTRVTRIAWKQPEDDKFGDLEFQLKTTPQIRFDWRDNPINPTSGTLLFSRVSYINALNDEANRDNFWKWEIGMHFYLSFRKVVILATNIRYGDSLSSGGGDLPENERFRLGGSNGMRGFAYGGIGQYLSNGDLRTVTEESDGEAGFVGVEGGNSVLNGSIELRFPISRKTGLWGAAFLDYGALSDGITALNGNSFRFSVGGGVRWLIGGQIPLRLDYGIVLDRRCSEVDFATGDCIRKEEPGALDFGLLYTF